MNLQKVPVDKIVIPEVRASAKFDPEQEAIFKATVQQFGVIQPIVVRPLPDGRYELIAGKHRLEELKNLGNKEVDAVVIPADDKQAIMMHLAENLARGKGDPVQEAKVLKKFIETGGTIEEAAKLTGHTPEWVKLRLAIGDLPQEIQDAISDGVIGVGHVLIAGQLPTPQEMEHALKYAIQFKWTQPVLENYVARRIADLEAAKAQGEMQAPPPVPTYEQAERMATTYECSGCLRIVDRIQIRTPPICEECWTLLKYVTSQIGAPKEAMQEIYHAVQHWRDFQRWRAEKLLLETYERERGQTGTTATEK
jgi:ParB family chromosome partitioning protein